MAGSASGELVVPAAVEDVGLQTLEQAEEHQTSEVTLQDNDQSMVSLDKSMDKLQQALTDRDALKNCGATPKAKAAAKRAPKAKASPKAKATTKGSKGSKPTVKAAAKQKPQAKSSKKAAKTVTKTVKKAKEVKMTRECIYSRAYHAAFHSLAYLLYSRCYLPTKKTQSNWFELGLFHIQSLYHFSAACPL